MNVGLYFGSFNPIHHAHLIIANTIINDGLADKVWFVVSPKNPLKESASLLNENHRLRLVQLAIDGEPHLRAVDVEFSLPRPSYTSVTLARLSEKYPQHRFAIIMGSDSFQNIARWKNYQYILKNHEILIYNRPGHVVTDTFGGNVKILDAPLLELSATRIRECIKAKKSVRYMLPDNVIVEIEKGGYYRK